MYMWDCPPNKKHTLSTAAYITYTKMVSLVIITWNFPFQLSKGSNRRC